MATGRQTAAARALLGWSQKDLADAVGVHANAAGSWEAHDAIPYGRYRAPIVCRRIQEALLKAGILTVAKPTIGVRFVKFTQ